MVITKTFSVTKVFLLTVLFVVLFIAMTGQPAQGLTPSPGISFKPAENIAVGTEPVCIAAGDLNGDGIADLAVANEISDNISILINQGNSTFLPVVNIPITYSPSSIIIGDFNADSKNDLVLTCGGYDYILILLGKGDGTFNPPVKYKTDDGNWEQYMPITLIAGDFNKDGKNDLAVGNHQHNKISIFAGVGNGTFQAPAEHLVGQQPYMYIRSITKGDFNNDGKLDIAVANQGTDNISVLLGNGNGTFNTAVSYVAGDMPRGITAGDFNKDGKIDLAVSNYSSHNLSVFIGNGDGTFKAAVNYAVGTDPVGIANNDFNGDGKVDLIVTNRDQNSISALKGNGDGTFGAANNYLVGNMPLYVTTGDFNGDGKSDLAVVNNGSNNISILINNTQFFIAPASTIIPGVSKNLMTLVSQNLRATGGVKCVDLVWNAEKNTAGLIGYNIYRSTTPDLQNLYLLNKSPVILTKYKDAGGFVSVVPGTTYYYIVRPVYVGPATNQASAVPKAAVNIIPPFKKK
jgi:hypothetical protein